MCMTLLRFIIRLLNWSYSREVNKQYANITFSCSVIITPFCSTLNVQSRIQVTLHHPKAHRHGRTACQMAHKQVDSQ